MKKLLFVSATAFLFVTATSAQTNEAVVKHQIKVEKKQASGIKKEIKEEKKELRKLEGKEVSYQAKQSFFSDFGNIPVTKWERTRDYDEATFNQNGTLTTAFYDYDAHLIGTTAHKLFSDIPMKAQKYINNKYGDYKKVEVVYFDDNEINDTDMILYGNRFDDEDNYFVELKNGNKFIVLQVSMYGDVSFFREL